MKASIVIPCKGRQELLDRTVESILNASGVENVEIIAVDDFSDPPIEPKHFRVQDKLIRLNSTSGAAVARNVGIDKALGEVIFLMDSDDTILERDFISDSDFALRNNALCFSEIESQNYSSEFPVLIRSDTYFEDILYRFPFICQTSSLYFPKSLNLRFDESLPKHQDWDFVYSSALSNNIPVIKGPGKIFFDRSDKNSISRTVNYSKSEPWVSKLENTIENSKYEFVRFYLLGPSSSHYSLFEFFRTSTKFVLSGKMRIVTFLKKIFYRLT